MSFTQKIAKNLKITFKNVLKDFSHYLCFFVAIFAVGTLISSLLFALNARRNDFLDSTVKAYTYVDKDGQESQDVCHMRFENMTNSSYTIVYNNVLRYDESLPINRIEYEIYSDGFGNKRYNAWISLKEPLKSSAIEVKQKLFDPTEDEYACVVYTEAYNAGRILRDITAKAVFSIVAASPVCLVGLMFLYILRLNHFKFLYGVYMSFGADFKKLFSTAAGEMSAVTVLTCIPSIIAGYIISALVLGNKGVSVPFGLSTVVITLFAVLIITVSAVYYPMKLLSRETPVELLMTRDNSNLVTSPKISFKLFGASFPSKYELFGMLRFRKYYLKLLLSTAAFCVAFVVGFCLSGMSKEDNAERVEAFEIINGAEITEKEDFDLAMQRAAELVAALDKVDGVDYYTIDNEILGVLSKSHLLLKNKNLYNADGHIIESREQRDYSSAACEFVFTSYDELMVEKITSGSMHTVKGDPSLVLDTTQKYVIVSEKIYGKKVFDFNVGDKISLAKYVSGTVPIGEIKTSLVDVLADQIDYCDFKFEEYTVCAVVEDEGEDGYFTVGLNTHNAFYYAEAYAAPKIDVYLELGAEIDDKENVRLSILGAIGNNGNWTLHENEDFYNSSIRQRSAREEFCRICGVLLLIFSPLIWIFSQIMFYKKREKEMYILRALGAFERDIFEIHVMGGIILAAVSLVLTSLVSLAACYGGYFLSTELTRLGIGKIAGLNSGAYHSFYFPGIAIIVCAVVSVIAGLFSALFPYIVAKRENRIKKGDITP